MTVRIFIRRWRSHGMYKVLSAWKRYTQERKLRRKDKLVADAQNEFTMLHRQLEEARRAVANAGSEKEREVSCVGGRMPAT